MIKPKYSICITHYNYASTLRNSLESILNQINSDFEVVVVDNMSTDGSEFILNEFVNKKEIKLIRAKCSRGRGRQIAFENSSGEYIIANLDMDDIFKPRLGELLKRYHDVADGKLLWAESRMKGKGFWGGESFTIAPSLLLKDLGGWNDLQLFEDLELCSRAARNGKYCRGQFDLLKETNLHSERKRTLIGRMKWKYLRYREILRIGLPMQLWNKRETKKQKLIKIWMKVCVLPFYGTYKDPFNYEFDCDDPKYAVTLDATRQSIEKSVS